MNPKNFFPVPWLEANKLSEDKNTLEFWADFFKESYSLDFFRTSVGNKRKVLKNQYYGKRKPAYSYLGPTFCPTAFNSERIF